MQLLRIYRNICRVEAYYATHNACICIEQGNLLQEVLVPTTV